MLLVPLLVLPATAQKVKIDYNKRTDFSRFKTYAWVPGTPVFDPQLDRYIKNSVIDVLLHSGMTEATVDKADLLVTYHAAIGTDLSVGTAIDPTYAASGGVAVPGHSVWESSGGIATHVTKGSLTFELIDRAANRPIWTGTAKHTVSEKSSERLDQVQKSLDKLFRHFPPTAKRTS